MTDKIVVFCTCAPADAQRIARHLVDSRVAACVNILPGARSIYRWQGKVEDAEEQLLLIKSSRDRFPALQLEIEKVHPYEIPELVAVPIVDGSRNYLQWLDTELGEAGAGV